ncbi:MAG: hypothetical protein WA133_11820 [Syntrophales bacterium]
MPSAPKERAILALRRVGIGSDTHGAAAVDNFHKFLETRIFRGIYHG